MIFFKRLHVPHPILNRYSFNLRNNSRRWVILFSPFYRWGNWDLERFRNLTKSHSWQVFTVRIQTQSHLTREPVLSRYTWHGSASLADWLGSAAIREAPEYSQEMWDVWPMMASGWLSCACEPQTSAGSNGSLWHCGGGPLSLAGLLRKGISVPRASPGSERAWDLLQNNPWSGEKVGRSGYNRSWSLLKLTDGYTKFIMLCFLLLCMFGIFQDKKLEISKRRDNLLKRTRHFDRKY